MEYVFRKGVGWCPFPSYCKECGGYDKYCCEASPYYDTDEYWWAKGQSRPDPLDWLNIPMQPYTDDPIRMIQDAFARAIALDAQTR